MGPAAEAQRMRVNTYQRWEAKYDRAEDVLDYQLCLALGRLLGR